MTSKEVKDKLSKYYKIKQKINDLKFRLYEAQNGIINEESDTVDRLNKEIKTMVARADEELARTLDILSNLTDVDSAVTVLKMYHIDGLTDWQIANEVQLCVDYVRTKRWRLYKRLAKILKERA